MNYLVIKDDIITQVCTSIEDLLKYLEVNVTDKGIVKIGNNNLPTTYNMKDYTKEEVMSDIIRYRLKTIESMLKIGIYKLERI